MRIVKCGGKSDGGSWNPATRPASSHPPRRNLMPCRHLLAIALLIAATCVNAAAQEVGVKDPALTYVGRFDFSQAGEARAAWPGTSVKLRFSGTGVSATLRALDQDWVQVVVDG